MNAQPPPDLDAYLDRLERRLPYRAGRFLQWLRQPHLVWLRVPLSALLLVGGLFSFLPVLGIWMLPLGLILLAEDLPMLRAPLARLFAWIEAKWEARKQRTARSAKAEERRRL